MIELLKDILNSQQLPENIAWKRKLYTDNEVVVRTGEPGISLYFIEKGKLRVTRRVDLGAQKHIQPGIGELKAGDFFGESCLHVSLPRTATVTAISEAVVLEINGDLLNEFLEKNPDKGLIFYKYLFGVSIERLSSVNHSVEKLMAWGLKAHQIDQYI